MTFALDDSLAAAAPGPEERRVARGCLTVLAGLGTASVVGVASSLYLVNELPLLLVALSPLGRHIVLAAPLVDPLALLTVVVTRRMLFFAPCYRLGGALGPYGIVWVEARSARLGVFIRWIERLFQRASRTVVLCMAGPVVSALAGSAGMPARVFATLAGLGVTLRVLLLLGFAGWAEAPIRAVLAFIETCWIPGTVLIVAAIAIQRWRHRSVFGPPWA